jgi:flagellar biosynthesis protein FlhA
MAKTATKNERRRVTLQEYMIPVALVGILVVLILPLPTWLLDILLALNISISFVVLFVSLYMGKPLEFTSFPAVLLITTLFRLSMNVAATRLVLLNGDQGHAAAGSVIQAFGNFVVGGNYFIGIVIFILISIVNLKVITKGSGRIAEVAARFTLDAMPGKQMAIDSDLNTGLIKEEEAKARRKELSQEAEFYGAMDGAAKFVSGDAIAGVFITGINIAGGFLIGIIQKGMDWRTAAETYTILTIGDGLVSQIPSIIISTAAGLIVARAASGEDLGNEVVGQLSKAVQPLFLSCGICAMFALVPGLPFFPFMVLASSLGLAGILRQRVAKAALLKAKTQPKETTDAAAGAGGAPKPGSTEEVTGLLNLDTLELELGYELVNLVEGGVHGDLIERIRSLRRQFALDYGFVVPPIHIRDNVRLKPGQYRVLLRGSELGASVMKARHLLAMDPGNVSNPLKGTPTKEPAFGLDALWIAESERERAQFAGYTVVDLSTVITTHLTELVKAHAHELLGRQEAQMLIDNLKKDYPKVVEELIPNLLTLGQVQQVLTHLLREQISIRDLKTILETLADWAPNVKHPEKLAEFVRRKLSRSITSKYLSNEGILTLASLTPNLERNLTEAVQQTDEGSFLALEPRYAQVLINKLNKAAEKFAELGQTPLLLVSGHLRPALFRFVERFAPGFAIVSHQEIAPNVKVQSLGVISVEELTT